MAARNKRATLQSDLMSGTVERGRKKAHLALGEVQTVSPEASKIGVATGAKAPSDVDQMQSLLCAKGSATAAGFRPWHWSYESVAPPQPAKVEATRSPTAVIEQGSGTKAPSSIPMPAPRQMPTPAPRQMPAPPPRRRAPSSPALELPYQPEPRFDYPCNATASVADEHALRAERVTDRSEERAVLLSTTKAIAALIATVLDAKDAALAARREELQRGHGMDASGCRAGVQAKPPKITAESLIAELKTARRGSVRALRKRVRPFSAAFLVSAWSR